MLNKISINCQSSIKISSEKIIYFDPYNIKEELKDADYIFITHNHYDHFDITSINKIINSNTKIIFPESMHDEVIKASLECQSFTSVVPNKTYQLDELKFETVPSYNIKKNYHLKSQNWVGYLITIDNNTLYIPGDTDVIPSLENINCDIAFIPIGGTYTMDYKEAATFINKIKPKTVIPIHYGSIVGDIDYGTKFCKLLDNSIECKLLIK